MACQEADLRKRPDMAGSGRKQASPRLAAHSLKPTLGIQISAAGSCARQPFFDLTKPQALAQDRTHKRFGERIDWSLPGQPTAPSPKRERLAKLNSVKRAVTPDSVHFGCPKCGRHSSGPLVTQTARCYLPANSPCGTTRIHDTANRVASGWPIWYCCA
jgi:hypothetical protein